jgi:hypothetical protein
MAARDDTGPRMLRCPACNAGLPVDGVSIVVTCSYCSVRVEIDQRGRAHGPGARRHATPAPRSHAAWLVFPIVLLVSGGMAAYQWSRAQSSVPTPTATRTPTVAPPIATLHEVAAPEPPPIAASEDPSPPEVVETPSPDAHAPAPAKPGAKPHAPDVTPTGPVISVDAARKSIEPQARACMKTAKVHHLLAYMGNSKVGPVKVLSDSRTHTDGKHVALAKTALGRCLDQAGASVRVSAFKSNYVRLDVRNDDVPDPLGALPAKPDPKAVRAVIASFDEKVKACARKHGKEGSRASFRFTIAGPSGKVDSVSVAGIDGPFRACALAIYEGARFTPVQPATYSITVPLDL